MFNKNTLKNICRLLLLGVAGSWIAACTEEIDMSNRYTFTEETALSYLEGHEQYSEYVRLLKELPISTLSESTVAQLLSARGHFTVFAPTDDAIQLYLDSLQRKGIIATASWDAFTSQKTLDSIKQVIVYNSIIDGGDQMSYDIGLFPRDNVDFGISNMNDRKISVLRGKINSDSIYVNGEWPISLKNRDIKVINGHIHEMEDVIAPSDERMFNLFDRWAKTEGNGFTVTSKLILACGLDDTLRAYRDETWERLYLTNQVKDLPKHSSFGQVGSLPQHRRFGFTVFAEIDQVWEGLLGKSAKDITVEDVKNYLISTGAFTDPGTTTDDNYADQNNIINQFVTYHILPMRISRDRLVVHFLELGYDYRDKTASPSIAITDYFTTMGKPRLLKVFESKESKGIYLNRFPIMRNGRGEFSQMNGNYQNDYHESGKFKQLRGAALSPDENVGVEVLSASDVNVSNEVALNGIIYPIRKLLGCTDNIRNQMLNERIRIDVATMFPEMLSNDLHGIKQYYTEGATNCRAFPVEYQYLADVEMQEGTMFYYLPGYQCGWANNEGDEFNIIGQYEFTMKLPPVPKAGHYELRFGVATGSYVRSMAQVYWGKDKNNMPAHGIPMDLRQSGLYRRLYNGSNIQEDSDIGWEEDVSDQATNDEVDKKLRNKGFMKAPKSWTWGGGGAVRDYETISRRIMVSEDMEPDQDYYIKFKSVLESDKKEFFMDYIEYVAKEVFDNPEEAEDIW